MEDTTKIVLPAIAVRGVIPLPGNDFKIVPDEQVDEIIKQVEASKKKEEKR